MSFKPGDFVKVKLIFKVLEVGVGGGNDRLIIEDCSCSISGNDSGCIEIGEDDVEPFTSPLLERMKVQPSEPLPPVQGD